MYELNKFSDEEKDACLPIVGLLMECTDKARKEGILALEDFVVKTGNDFLIFATMMILEGLDPEFVKGILETLLCTENFGGAARLERIIIIEGVLSIQAGNNPRILQLKLLSMLGERYLRMNGLFPGINPV